MVTDPLPANPIRTLTSTIARVMGMRYTGKKANLSLIFMSWGPFALLEPAEDRCPNWIPNSPLSTSGSFTLVLERTRSPTAHVPNWPPAEGKNQHLRIWDRGQPGLIGRRSPGPRTLSADINGGYEIQARQEKLRMLPVGAVGGVRGKGVSDRNWFDHRHMSAVRNGRPGRLLLLSPEVTERGRP